MEEKEVFQKIQEELVGLNQYFSNYYKKSLGKVSLGYSLVRGAHFSVNHSLLPVLEFLLSGNMSSLSEFKTVAWELFELIRRDCENIENGIYPISVLKSQNPLEAIWNYPAVLRENLLTVQRKVKGILPKPSANFNEYRQDLPEYVDQKKMGYWSEERAEIYEEHMEILFAGATDAMRRSIVPEFKKIYPGNGEGLRFLELGAGTGRMTRFMRLAYPKARITVLEVSEPFLSKARKNLQEFKRIDFVQGRADRIPFLDENFDLVYSSFLFHEVPFSVRKKIVSESCRVLRPQGVVGIVDCLQNEDPWDYSWAKNHFFSYLDQTYLADYWPNPLEGFLKNAGLSAIHSDKSFFSKAIISRKSS